MISLIESQGQCPKSSEDVLFLNAVLTALGAEGWETLNLSSISHYESK
jgi:hypothetical protein